MDFRSEAADASSVVVDSRMPQAYRDGFCDFYGRNFKVSPAVLIPRPETEQMIDAVLALAGKAYLPGVKPEPVAISKSPVILDVGTGSGCIATTLALELSDAKVFAVDISLKALEVAKKNAKALGAKVEFSQSDLLSEVSSLKPDVIAANLPYVDPEWTWLDKEALSFEPSLALYAENGGLALIFRLIDEVQSACRNSEKTYLILEADPCQHEKIIAYAKEHGFTYEKTRGYILVFRISF